MTSHHFVLAAISAVIFAPIEDPFDTRNQKHSMTDQNYPSLNT